MTTEAEQEVAEQTIDIDAVAAEAEARNDTVDPVKALATEFGWAEKDQWRGNPDDWRDAGDFLKHGMKRSRESADELRSLRTQVTQIGRVSETLMRDRVEEAVREAEQRLMVAAKNDDHAGVRAANEEIGRLTATVSQPPVDTSDFMSRNASWYGRDPAATALAQSVTAQLSSQGVDPAEQLRRAEEQVRQRFPEHFGQPKPKPPASVAAPDTRAANVRAKAKGFSDLPAEAQRAGQDFLKRGMVKTLDDYARVYLEENA